MASMENILLVVSGVGQTEAMSRMLLNIPLFRKSKVTILHVIAPKISAQNMKAQQEKGVQVLAEAVKALALDSSQVDTILQEGDPKDVVCQVAEELNVDLIVMGSRGLKRLEAIIKNSISQYVFQLASCSMLFVKDDVFVQKIRRVLVTMDKSEASQQALQLAINMVKGIDGGEIILVHVISNLGTIPKVVKNPEEDPVLAPAVKQVQKLGIKYRCESPSGKPGFRIKQLADDLDVNLLLMGSPDRRPSIAKGLPDFDRLLGDSVSDYMRREATCPVLMVR